MCWYITIKCDTSSSVKQSYETKSAIQLHIERSCVCKSTIRIYHYCLVWIQKSVRGSLFGIARLAEWWRTVILRDRFFYPHQTVMIDSFSCIPFHFLLLVVIKMRDINQHFNMRMIYFCGCSYTLCKVEDTSCHFVNLCGKVWRCRRRFSRLFRLKLMLLWNNITLKLLHSQESWTRSAHEFSARRPVEITWVR